VPRGYGRSRHLHLQREPKRLASIGPDIQQREQWLTPPAARAFSALRDAASRDGVELQIVSAFRSIAYQLGIVERKLQRGLAMHEILRVSAAPGYSEHHSGRALDITAPGYAPVEEIFERSAAFAWLTRNASPNAWFHPSRDLCLKHLPLDQGTSSHTQANNDDFVLRVKAELCSATF